MQIQNKAFNVSYRALHAASYGILIKVLDDKKKRDINIGHS